MGKICIALVLALVTLTTFGISLGAYNMYMRNTDVTSEIALREETTQVKRDVYLEDMAPGEPGTLELRLNADKGKTYQLTLAFTAGEAAELAEYVDVRIQLGDRSIEEAPLTDYISGKTAQFNTTFTTDDSESLYIIYTIGAHIGNEAQGKRADLTITLTAEKQ